MLPASAVTSLGQTTGPGLLPTSDLQTPQHLPDGIVDDQIGVGVGRSGIAVDKDQTVAAVVADQAGGRVNDQRSASYYQHISIFDLDHGLGKHVLIEVLFVKDHIGLDDAAAVLAAWDSRRIFKTGLLDVRDGVEAAAVGAIVS